MAEQDTATHLAHLRGQVALADRLRVQAETQKTAAVERLAEIDAQIVALGVKPDEIDAKLAALDKDIVKELGELDVGLREEIAAYQAILTAVKG